MMDNPIVGGALAAVCGALVTFIGYFISGRALKSKYANAVGLSLPVKMVLYIGLFLAVYFLSDNLPWGDKPLYIGAAVGIIISIIITTFLLLKKTRKNANTGEDAVSADGSKGDA